MTSNHKSTFMAAGTLLSEAVCPASAFSSSGLARTLDKWGAIQVALAYNHQIPAARDEEAAEPRTRLFTISSRLR